MCNPKKNDFVKNRSYLKRVANGTIKFYDEERRNTSFGGCSKWVGGSLVLSQNAIERTWFSYKGLPPRAVSTNLKTGEKRLGMSLYEGNASIGPSEITNMRTKLLRQSTIRFRKAAEAKAIMIMEYIAERRSIANMLRALMDKVVWVYKQCRTRKFKTIYVKVRNEYGKLVRKPKRIEMTFNEKWLEYHFALAPMMADIANAIEGWKEVAGTTVRRSARMSIRAEDMGQNSTGKYYATRSIDIKYTITGKILAGDPLSSTATRAGLTPSDGWALLPWSFVVDWIFNVSNIIITNSRPSYTLIQPSLTQREVTDIVGSGFCTLPPNSQVRWETVGSGTKRKSVLYKRSYFHVPGLSLVPSIDSLEWWHYITSYALLRSLAKS